MNGNGSKSAILGNMLKRGPSKRGLTVAVALGQPKGGPPDTAPADGTPPGPPPDHGGDGNLQHAYDQATQALEVLASQYPEAGDILKELETKWAGWMGGHAQTPSPPGSPPPAQGQHVGQVPDESEVPPEPGNGGGLQPRRRMGESE